MLDALAILASCGSILYVAYRAMRLDRTTLWFEPLPQPPRRGPAPRRRGRQGEA